MKLKERGYSRGVRPRKCVWPSRLGQRRGRCLLQPQTFALLDAQLNEVLLIVTHSKKHNENNIQQYPSCFLCSAWISTCTSLHATLPLSTSTSMTGEVTNNANELITEDFDRYISLNLDIIQQFINQRNVKYIQGLNAADLSSIAVYSVGILRVGKSVSSSMKAYGVEVRIVSQNTTNIIHLNNQMIHLMLDRRFLCVGCRIYISSSSSFHF